MLLATGLLLEFARFLQIISWIILPVLVLAVLITVFLHYRKKRKETTEGEAPENFILRSPEDIRTNLPGGVHVLFDHTGLIRQYQQRLSYNQARYTALKQDFEKLAIKYSAATGQGKVPVINHKTYLMQHSIEQMQTAIDLLTEQHAAEKKQLLAKVEELQRLAEEREMENDILKKQLNRSPEDENNECLKDLLEEKRAQVIFLQGQVDQRIRSYHEAERQHHETKSELKQVRKTEQGLVTELEAVRNELQGRRDKIDQLLEELSEKDRQLAEKQNLFASREDQVTYLSNVLQELTTQNENLNAALADNQDLVAILREQLLDERSRKELTEEKLETNRQMLRKLHKTIGESIGIPETQVIELKPMLALEG